VSLLGILFLTALRRERAIILPLAAGVAVNATLNALWIPTLGSTGSAWAAVISHTLTAVWLARLAWTACGTVDGRAAEMGGTHQASSR
jgi:O-antigen/teichoic acid export membrane protein